MYEKTGILTTEKREDAAEKCVTLFRKNGIVMIVLIIVAAIFLLGGIIILIGKGDNLIAGYNTASKEEKSQYNIKRLRGLIGGILVVLAPMILLLHRGDESMTAIFITLTIVLCIVVVILANTWAKKK